MEQCSRKQLPCRVPPISVMAGDLDSPITAALQNISWLLSGGAPRLELIWRPAACESMRGYCMPGGH
eukprot:4872414-Pyramimonas_sp.AAC.1